MGSKDGEHCGGSFHCCWGSDVGHYGNADHRLHPVPVYNGDEAVLCQGQVRRKQVNKKRWFFRCVIFFSPKSDSSSSCSFSRPFFEEEDDTGRGRRVVVVAVSAHTGE